MVYFIFGPARQQLQPRTMQPSQCRGQSSLLQGTAAARSADGTAGGSDFGLSPVLYWLLVALKRL